MVDSFLVLVTLKSRARQRTDKGQLLIKFCEEIIFMGAWCYKKILAYLPSSFLAGGRNSISQAYHCCFIEALAYLPVGCDKLFVIFL